MEKNFFLFPIVFVCYLNAKQVVAADFEVAAAVSAAMDFVLQVVAAVSAAAVSGTAVYESAVSDSDSAMGDNVAAEVLGDNA